MNGYLTVKPGLMNIVRLRRAFSIESPKKGGVGE
jgi:hypothetical protein